jgi:hypothetical protein
MRDKLKEKWSYALISASWLCNRATATADAGQLGPFSSIVILWRIPYLLIPNTATLVNVCAVEFVDDVVKDGIITKGLMLRLNGKIIDPQSSTNGSGSSPEVPSSGSEAREV